MVLTRTAREVADEFAISEAEATLELGARYNIAPTQDVLAVRAEPDGGRALVLLHWGLIPHWAREKAVGHRMINARSETAAEKPAFRDALRRRRCIVPADGFYEWMKPAKKPGEKGRPKSVPYYFSGPAESAEGRPPSLAIAGLHESWTDRQTGEVIESCTLLTTEANATVAPVHHRMPVLLDEADWSRWLDPNEQDAAAVAALLAPAPPGALSACRVDPLVNDPRNDEPACIAPAA